MKKAITFLSILFVGLCFLQAQSPQSFKYQAIARDEAGSILSNWDIGIRTTIIKGGEDGNPAYVETHLIKSNAYGIISIAIGEGQAESGSMDAIDWGSDKFYIKMAMDLNGSGVYKEMGTTQLYAVPYALYAEKAGALAGSGSGSNSGSGSGSSSGKSGSRGAGVRSGSPNSKLPATGNSFTNANDGNLGVGTTNPTEKLEVNGNIKANGTMILLDRDGNPRELTLNPDGTWTTKFSCEGSILDKRDGKSYNIVKIGQQCWMAQNLNIGTKIDVGDDAVDDEIIEKYCYDGSDANCDIYGGLYQWDEMMNWYVTEGAKGICMERWHIPTDEEWKVLEGTVDSNFPVGDNEWSGHGIYRGFDAGLHLKSPFGWNSGGNGDDAFGFSALPCGTRYPLGIPYYRYLGTEASFWTSSKSSGSLGRDRRLAYHEDGVMRFNYNVLSGNSVRCLKDFECGDSITDSSDGKNYGTVEIGDQCWMSQNLNVGTRIDGDTEPSTGAIVEKYCYDDLEANCDIYGGLYTWDEAMRYVDLEGSQGICPIGWHIPTDDEWKILEGTVDTEYPVGDPEWDSENGRGFDAGFRLKSTTGWSGGNADDTFGFSAMPAGYRLHSSPGSPFDQLGEYADFWSSSEFDTTDKWLRELDYSSIDIGRYKWPKDYGFSIRCTKDEVR